MLIALYRYFGSLRAPAAAEKEPVVQLARILTFGALIVAGGYFTLLFALASR